MSMHRRIMTGLKNSTGIAAALAALAPRASQAMAGIGMATLCLAAFSQPSLANPTGASIASGQATITAPSATQLNINQTTKIVIIDWKSFNIAAGETTKFSQPGTNALAVNRIGGADPATILGNLIANGRVILIDGNGILFGPNAKVNVGALLATTSDAKNEDIISGKATFDKAGNPNAQIVNNGTITAASGMVGLVAPAVANNGIIRAKLGQVVLGASNVFTVDFTGDGLISFPVDPNIIAGAIDANGQPVKALVANNGKIEGATVLLSARAAADLVTNVISTKGEIVAKSIGEKGGHIVLDAGEGSIALAGAKLDASGKNGGGSITVGSANTASVTADNTTVLDASATQSGNGGSIYVNSANTAFHGTAKAKGGSVSGDGGKIETSGQVLDVTGINVDASAANGVAGNWLLDPVGLTINSTLAGTNSDHAERRHGRFRNERSHDHRQRARHLDEREQAISHSRHRYRDQRRHHGHERHALPVRRHHGFHIHLQSGNDHRDRRDQRQHVHLGLRKLDAVERYLARLHRDEFWCRSEHLGIWNPFRFVPARHRRQRHVWQSIPDRRYLRPDGHRLLVDDDEHGLQAGQQYRRQRSGRLCVDRR